MDMYYHNNFNAGKFLLLSILLLMTMYSRVNIGCKTLLDAVYCALIGLLIGVVYYSLIKDYYKADYWNTTLTQVDTSINNFFQIN